MRSASKQVLVMRKFPALRTGKYVAQGSHASMGALLKLGQIEDDKLVIPLTDPFVKSWLLGPFTKIALKAETEEELRELMVKAEAAGIPVALITDAGHTEFKGVPTVTALGVGPASAEEIDKITGHLTLF